MNISAPVAPPQWLSAVSLATTPLLQEPLSKHTSYGIGGPAEVFAKPTTQAELAQLLRAATGAGVPIQFLGSGSNCLVSDTGVKGLMISLAGAFKQLDIKGSKVVAQSGVMLGHMVKLCLKGGLTGMESLVGVPGTVGGALIMNAGAFGGEISMYLERAAVLTLKGEAKEYGRDELSFSYRESSFAGDEIIIEATFNFPEGDTDESATRKAEASARRKASQPLTFRSAGSVFKNPSSGMAAGMLIDQAGLKGTRRGGAEISSKHANFVINHGSASSDDVAHLIKLAAKTVKEQHGVQLELEIRTLGFEPGFWEEAGLGK
ncbi:MAG: UDP-N-acetylmuramate dehydrogenase [Candidatus Marinimicrobia bacterium]|nr:UDP-N-acetylmuramate dehydrogenase [Candidatus Neomarinimicrobiota bacterium]